ncbi:Succinate dehydrogenase subunit 8A mitochondrial [Bienertia sinuspersici]
MIYRKWSLLSGTVAATTVIAGAVVVGNLLFGQEDPFRKPIPKKQSEFTSK